MKALLTTITTDETYELAKLASNGVVAFVKKNPNTSYDVIADIIQSTLDGFISARNDNEKTERKQSKNANK